MESIWPAMGSWLLAHGLQLATTAAVIVAYVLLDRFGAPRLAAGADRSDFKPDTGVKAIRVARFLTGLVGCLLLIIVWGVDLTSMLVFSVTSITFLGVALFASWSMLSNVTAYFVLLLQPSFKHGNFIRVVSADNYVEGYIAELNFFNTKLMTEEKETVIYPNNLLLATPVLVNPQGRLAGMGKLVPPPPPDKNQN
jgi:small-conductance mechanosensitive channel